MAADTDKIISTLNDLIETCKDGEQGFRTAADAVKDQQVKSLFLQYSSQRTQLAAELKEEVRRRGGNPEQAGSVSGALHRGWMNIKSAVSGMDELAIVTEAERGEDVAVRVYQEALTAGLPSDVQALVQQQYERIKQAHDRVRELEKTMGGG